MPVFIDKETVEWITMLQSMRDNHPKKERDRRMRIMRQALMEMINDTHILMIGHKELEND